MKRRTLISAAATSLLAAPLATPLASWAQGAVRTVGFLSSLSPVESAHLTDAFRKGLAEAGFVEGKNIAIEFRWAEGNYDRLPALASELVNKPVAVLATAGGTTSALAGKAATTTIPVVVLSGGDFVKLGLVASLNRPGANVTGVSQFAVVLAAKRLEVLRELKPGISNVAFLVNPKSPNAEPEIAMVQQACIAIGCKVNPIKASTAEEIDTAFKALTSLRNGALMVLADPFMDGRREQIIAHARRLAIPGVYGAREYVVAGGLLSYGVNFADTYRQSGVYVGRILKGDKPADLPVMQPTRFDVALNLTTAKALGLKVPQSVLLRVTETIE